MLVFFKSLIVSTQNIIELYFITNITKAMKILNTIIIILLFTTSCRKHLANPKEVKVEGWLIENCGGKKLSNKEVELEVKISGFLGDDYKREYFTTDNNGYFNYNIRLKRGEYGNLLRSQKSNNQTYTIDLPSTENL